MVLGVVVVLVVVVEVVVDVVELDVEGVGLLGEVALGAVARWRGRVVAPVRTPVGVSVPSSVDLEIAVLGPVVGGGGSSVAGATLVLVDVTERPSVEVVVAGGEPCRRRREA